MANNIDQEIRARIEFFAEELAALVRQAAVESVQTALGQGRRGPGRPRKAVGRRVRRVQRRAKGARRGPGRPRKGAGKRVRRSSGQIEALATRVFAHVKSNQGQRLEEISRALKIPSSELKRPVATLMDAKRLRTKGQKRGTQYFPGAGRKAKA
jgi:hypothetical protein